ncbi:CWC16 protein, partial [Thamnocephalis sphaerospora]
MSERKVLNKYYPPDFDPSKIPRLRRPRDLQEKVRLMAPFSMRCTTCNEYVAKGKKFNARKETVQGEDYLGLKIFRFYIRCPRCSAEITFKTDPENSDYKCEQGAVRNFEPWREEKIQEKETEESEGQAAELDPMRALERRTEESKREMEIMDALDEIRIRNARNERVDQDAVLDRVLGEDPEEVLRREEEEIER